MIQMRLWTPISYLVFGTKLQRMDSMGKYIFTPIGAHPFNKFDSKKKILKNLVFFKKKWKNIFLKILALPYDTQ